MSIVERISGGVAVLFILIGVLGASPAAADSVYAVSNATNGNGTSHAFWLPGGDVDAPGTYYHWVPESNPTLTFNGTSWADSTTAVLRGRIQEADGGSPNGPILGGTQFDVEVFFVAGVDLAVWDAGGGDVKIENGSDPAGWRFFMLDPSQTASELTYVPGTGTGSSPIPSGSDINFDLRQPNTIPGNKVFGFQVGIGASMKSPDDVLGASSWIQYTDSDGALRFGDINIELTLVPTPSAALGGLAMLGLLGARRRRRRG